MRRWKLWLFGGLAVVGTVAAVLYAVAAAPGAKTKLDIAILVFTAAAAVTGFLGLVVAWLSYSLETGRIPKPDLAIVAGGELVRDWHVEIDLLDPDAGVADALREEHDRMEEVIGKLRPPNTPATTAALISNSFMFKEVSEKDIVDYRKEVAKYLREYEAFLKHRRAIEVLRARSAQMVLAFTNERAGMPAEGVRAVIQFPTDDSFRVWDPSDIPEPPEARNPPTPPRRRSFFEYPSITLPSLIDLPGIDRSLGSLRNVQPQGNVSPPTIREGSTIVEFSVKEVLHNLHEDTRDHPLVLQFNRAGSWTVPYELHARNLPQPRSGMLTLQVSVREGDQVATEVASAGRPAI